MRRQLKQSAPAHLAAVVDRPRTPPQPAWQGPPPSGVDTVLPRAALDKPYIDFFAEWASNLALLSSELVDHIYQSELARMRQRKV
jgi:alpha-beta hydrolase superfamily lysophospholipase